VTQQYQNPYDSKIEAVYVFPLPHNAAVNEFVMTIGERKIRGIIREREQARKIYEEASSAGLVASLLTEERPNIFTQSVANIEPGKQIDINIKYFNTLAYVDGWYEYVFPMVVGPRFNPAGSTDGIGAKSVTGVPASTGQKTEVSYLKPGERAADISVTATINAGVPIEALHAPNHGLASDYRGPSSTAVVTLPKADKYPNKDFVLRYKVAGGQIKSTVMTQRKDGEGYFTLMLYPPDALQQTYRQPLELVFTLDVSGSMEGAPLEQSKSAIRYALQHMDDRDTFQIIRFAGGASQFAAKPVPVTGENVRKALQFIESTEAGGGTVMREGIRASLDFPHDPSRLRFVTFLTDGFIGNEKEILAEVSKSLGPSRIFSFGVGSSPNRYLLDHMAKIGNGAVAYLPLTEKAEDVMAVFFDRISHPAMTDVTINFGQMKAIDTMPARVPDLFVGRPVIVTGKFNGSGKANVTVTGTVAGKRQTINIPVDLDAADQNHAGIGSVWARQQIAELSHLEAATSVRTGALANKIKVLSIQHNLVSKYTAFLAVDSSRRTDGTQGTTITVPVPVPDGVKYETTVKE
jgi:Ca-activated chloride channel family protein